MVRRLFCILIFIFSLILPSQLFSDSIPDCDLSREYVNSYIKIYAPSGWNEYSINDPVNVAVDVIGNETIIFRNDYEIRGFYLSNGIWQEIDKYPMIQDHFYLLLSPIKENMKNTGIATIYPRYGKLQPPIILRVVVFGYIYGKQEYGEQQVAAYTDILIFR
jgi:hypothetical protein